MTRARPRLGELLRIELAQDIAMEVSTWQYGQTDWDIIRIVSFTWHPSIDWTCGRGDETDVVKPDRQGLMSVFSSF